MTALAKHWHLSGDTKKRQSLAKLGQKNPMYGKQQSEEANKKRSVTLRDGYASGKYISVCAMKGRQHTEESKRKTSNSLMGHLVSDKSKLKNSFNHLGKKHTIKTKRLMSKKRIEYMINHSGPYVNTSIERKVKSQLSKNNIRFIQQWPIDNKFICDFFVPDLNLIIECDGDYWHNKPNVEIRDNNKNETIYKQGYNLIRIPEHIINMDSFKIIDMIGEC